MLLHLLRKEGTFKINKVRLYVPFVTLSINDNIKSIEDIT